VETDKGIALVTGASAGIGAAFAERLARDGYRLMLVARRRDRLEAMARKLGNAEVLEADLVEEGGLRRVAEWIQGEPRLTLLVNNAGFGTRGRFWQEDLDGQERMHRLHVMATVRLTHAALRGMVARDRGAVINVSSVAGFGATPGGASYCATKAWMNTFTEGVALDLRTARSRVRMQALCPGFTVTEFHEVAQMDRKKIPSGLWMRAEDVVDASLAGLASGRELVIPGAGYRLLAWLQKHMPPGLRRRVVLHYGRAAGRV
jgi:short-subunit dehydrogenase